MNSWVKTAAVLLLAALVAGGCPAGAAENPFAWPEIKTQARPHTYWWWMGSAVDTNNIARELARYHAAGLGGVHIIPIYGAKGWESNYIEYLSPKWMAMLSFTVSEARRLGMDVDMTTGTGWCFGGPHVTDEEANAIMVSRKFNVAAGGKLPASFDPTLIQALMAFGPDGQKVDLTGAMQADGSVNWRAPTGSWTVYAISQKPSGQKVKRAAPGGEGWMLNLDHPEAMTNYLRWFDAAFAHYEGPKPRAQYHDSYEYKMDWSPVFFAEFEKRRGYRLQDELDVFLTGRPADRAARVKCDYRETVSDIMAEETIPQWVEWSHAHGFITRNEAHGSPGNWLDLYADADIPETEMFYRDRNRLISKFASSAAHVAGKPLVSAETGTWLDEHFTETLGEMKFLLDDMFLSGVNHVFYHGTCYSPDEAGWPGWHFYASFEMNPRNSIWRDVPALNAYAARCQAVLQRGRPDNDILLYWPLHDFWSDPQGTVRNLTVHARDWFEEQPIGKTAQQLWGAGYQFDYISDRQLSGMPVSGHGTHQV
ncbi:MAG TPA: glycosyl hydrolase, partial [Verrucomicrobiae bacterium]|nr:glycosyl hydrolase [Verrucomicrobiae bacterium]